jgi:hypothetical protein
MLTPVQIFKVFPIKLMSERRFHTAKKAFVAAFSNRSSPVRRDKMANSMMSEPAPAEPKQRGVTIIQLDLVGNKQDSTDSPLGTPERRFVWSFVRKASIYSDRALTRA